MNRWQREPGSPVRIVILLSYDLAYSSGDDMGNIVPVVWPEGRTHPDNHGDIFDGYRDFPAGECAYVLVTHSENIVLRARRRVAEGKLLPEELAIIWRDDRGDRRIHVDKDGMPDWYPLGLFQGDLREVQDFSRRRRRTGMPKIARGDVVTTTQTSCNLVPTDKVDPEAAYIAERGDHGSGTVYLSPINRPDLHKVQVNVNTCTLLRTGRRITKTKSRPENPYTLPREEDAWEAGFTAGVRRAKEAAIPFLTLEKSGEAYHDVAAIDWTEVEE